MLARTFLLLQLPFLTAGITLAPLWNFTSIHKFTKTSERAPVRILEPGVNII